MIFKLIIGVVIIATIIYYLFCFLEIFGLVKFTEKNVTVKIPQMFIPFYYLLVSGEENHPKDSRISVSVDGQKTVNISHNITQVSVHISDEDYHGWRIGYILKTISVRVPRISLSLSRRIQGSLQGVVISSSPT